MPKQEWRTADSRCSGQTTTSSPLVIRHNSSKPASMASLHSGHVYDTKLHGRFYSDLTPTRTQQRVRPLYTNTEGPPYQQYQYTMAQPGDASPYSVSSELYKHVLPQYFQFSRPKSRGSVLVWANWLQIVMIVLILIRLDVSDVISFKMKMAAQKNEKFLNEIVCVRMTVSELLQMSKKTANSPVNLSLWLKPCFYHHIFV